MVEEGDLLVDTEGGMRLIDFWGEIKKVCQIMKLTVDIVNFRCYIS